MNNLTFSIQRNCAYVIDAASPRCSSKLFTMTTHSQNTYAPFSIKDINALLKHDNKYSLCETSIIL